jgi:hypothetical protein
MLWLLFLRKHVSQAEQADVQSYLAMPAVGAIRVTPAQPSPRTSTASSQQNSPQPSCHSAFHRHHLAPDMPAAAAVAAPAAAAARCQGDYVVLASEGRCLCGVDVAAPQQLRRRGSSRTLQDSIALLKDQMSASEVTDEQQRPGNNKRSVVSTRSAQCDKSI